MNAATIHAGLAEWRFSHIVSPSRVIDRDMMLLQTVLTCLAVFWYV
jgi:hypothetical protein